MAPGPPGTHPSGAVGELGGLSSSLGGEQSSTGGKPGTGRVQDPLGSGSLGRGSSAAAPSRSHLVHSKASSVWEDALLWHWSCWSRAPRRSVGTIPTMRGPLASVPTGAVTCWALPGFGRGWEVGEEKRSCLAPGGLWQMAPVFGPLRQDGSCRPQGGGGSSPGTAPTLPHVPTELQGFGEFLEWEPTQVGVLLSARPGG